MSTKSQKEDIFGAKMVASTTIDGLYLAIYANDILHVKVPKYYNVDVEIFEKAQNYIRILGQEKHYHFIIEFSSFSEVDPEMRKRRAGKSGTEFSLSDALVISNLPQKIMGDFYLRFNKPVRPTKFFYSLDKALDWTLKIKGAAVKDAT